MTRATATNDPAAFQTDVSSTVTANADIPAGTTITADMLTTINVPTTYRSPDALTDADTAVGSQACVTITQGSQVRSSELTGEVNTASLSTKLSKGKKAVSIDVSSEQDFANSLLHQGDKVTLHYYTQSDDSALATDHVLARDVTVLALDGYLSYESLTAGGVASYSNVTVEVSEKVANRIKRAQASGYGIWMVLSSSTGDAGGE